LREGDRVVAMESLDPEEGEILSLTTRGVGKRTVVSQYRVQGRGGKGIINLKVSEKTGEVIGARQVEPSDGLMLITQEGKIIRIGVSGVRVSGRSTQGVKLMDLGADDQVVAVAKLADGDGSDDFEDDDDEEQARSESVQLETISDEPAK
jgi:DNA gyrase subunit A